MKESFFKPFLFFKRLGQVFFVGFSVLLNLKLTGPQKLKLFFERLGGGFIKLGQILSLRQDFLSFEYISELLKLLNQIEIIPFEQIEMVFASETGKSINLFFSKFNPTPIASASIGQVYEAWLKDGTKVAVKIQRPGTEELFEADFILVCFFAGIIDFFRVFSSIRAHEVASDFISWTRKELNYKYESKNADVICDHSENHPQTIIPFQYTDLSTEKVLIQEFIEDAIHIDSIILGKVSDEKLSADGIGKEEMAYYLINDMMRQYFVDGFFHADPHPANLAFKRDNCLVYFDFGIVGEAREKRLLFLKTLYGIAKKDVDYLCKYFLEFGKNVMEEEVSAYIQVDVVNRYAYRKIFDKIKESIANEFKEEITEIINPWFKAIEDPESSIRDKTSAATFFKLINEAEKYGVNLPREIVLFFRSISMLDVIALQLSPNFDIIKALNIFFDDYPLDELEKIILEGNHMKEVGGKIIPVTDVDWEFFKESSGFEREKKFASRERLIDMVNYYSEKYEDVRSLLKEIKK